ncbi:MAG: AAA family ATPase [Deltaproteobacteria bacterium]|nr:AAA family ATPase [Deltaproteobacteria bacterium]
MTNPPAKQPTTLDQLKALGFSDEVISTPRRVVASVAGREKTGKTHFACTGPGPVIFFNIDIGTEGVVGKFQESGKQVFVYDVRVPKGAPQDTYKTMWTDFRTRVDAAYGLKEGTIVMDTGTEAYELARLAHFGKLTQVMPHHYVEVNSEWRELMRLAYDSTMNTIFIHKMKPKWVNNQRTSEYETAGFNEMDYLTQVNLIMYREDIEGGGMPNFSAFIKDCRQNPKISGTVLRGPMVDLGFLLSLVHAK